MRALQRGAVVRNRWALLGLVVVLGVALDQLTKRIALEKLSTAGMVPVIDGFFRFEYHTNAGAFFSLGSDMGPIFFVIVTLGAVALIGHLYRKAPPEHVVLRWALMLLLAGAIGNLVDRAMEGEVIDFLHLHYRDVFHWATFNVADVYITVGLGLLVLDMVRPVKRPASGGSGATAAGDKS